MWSSDYWLPGDISWSDLGLVCQIFALFLIKPKRQPPQEKFSNTSTTQTVPSIYDFYQVLPLSLLLLAARFSVESWAAKQFAAKGGPSLTNEDLKKTGECIWNFIYFTTFSVYSTYSLLNVHWRTSYTELWKDYPFQFMDSRKVRLV